MTGLRVSQILGILAFLASACHPNSPSAETQKMNPADPIATSVDRGSAADLVSRGAVRAKGGKEPVSRLADHWLTLTVQTQGADGEWWAVAAGGQLRTGEVLITEVELQRSAHIYVISVSASGKAALLYPDEESGDTDTLLGRGTHRLPPARSEFPYIKLDNEIGIERIFVMATPERVAAVDDELGDLVARVQRGESPSIISRDDSRNAAPPEPGKQLAAHVISPSKNSEAQRSGKSSDVALSEANADLTPVMKSRGTFRSRTNGVAVDGKPDTDGVIVIPFFFEHI